MYKDNSTWTSFDIVLKSLKQVLLNNQYLLSMIDNVIKKYFQNTINKTNTGSIPVKMTNIETRYFKLPFMECILKLRKTEFKNLVKDFAKMSKLS